MSAAVVCITTARLTGEAARKRAAACRAILGGEYSALGVVWDHQAGAKDRRLLAVMAGAGQWQAKREAARAWGDLSSERRAAITAALRRWRSWADKLR